MIKEAKKKRVRLTATANGFVPRNKKSRPYRPPSGAPGEQMRQQLLAALNQRVEVLGITANEAGFRAGVQGSHMSALLKGRKYWSALYLLDVYAALGGEWKFILPEKQEEKACAASRRSVAVASSARKAASRALMAR